MLCGLADTLPCVCVLGMRGWRLSRWRLGEDQGRRSKGNPLGYSELCSWAQDPGQQIALAASHTKSQMRGVHHPWGVWRSGRAPEAQEGVQWVVGWWCLCWALEVKVRVEGMEGNESGLDGWGMWKSGCMYMCNWFTLLYTWNQHDIVNLLLLSCFSRVRLCATP